MAVKVIELSPDEIVEVYVRLVEACQLKRRVRLAVDGEKVRVRVGQDDWSPAFGRLQDKARSA